jgi:hypothetical protein
MNLPEFSQLPYAGRAQLTDLPIPVPHAGREPLQF